MPSLSTLFGMSAEAEACRRLESAGFRILDRNWRRPWGELDIVAEKDDVVRFIEVKASARSQAGFEPFLRADKAKMAKVARTARTWLVSHRYGPDTPWQMDVISVIMEPDGTKVEHFENV